MRTPVAGEVIEALLEVEDHEHLIESARVVRCGLGVGSLTESFLLSLSHGKPAMSVKGAWRRKSVTLTVSEDGPGHEERGDNGGGTELHVAQCLGEQDSCIQRS